MLDQGLQHLRSLRNVGLGDIWFPVVHGFGDRDIILILAEDLRFNQYKGVLVEIGNVLEEHLT